MRFALKNWVIGVGCGLGLFVGSELFAKPPSPEQAFQLSPVQEDVDIERPTGDAAAKCTVIAETTPGFAGWVVQGPAGEMMRRFVDSNGDNKVDLWCYYKNGIEVYRDIDSDGNGKADQYRWLGTAGTRWAVDRDEDGRIDSWKSISAEEVSYELVESMRHRDPARFQRVLLTADELDGLGLGAERKKSLAAKIDEASKGFADMAKAQQVVAAGSQWLHFAAAPPGAIPAGTEGATKDLTVYENATAMLETSGKHGQLQIGTLVQVPGGWRLIDLPTQIQANAKTAGPGFFLAAAAVPANLPDNPMPGGITPEQQKLLKEIGRLDIEISKGGTPAALIDLNKAKADTLQQLAKVETNAQNQANWIRQLADAISTAAQAGQFPDAAKRLKSLHESLASQAPKDNLTAFVKFRYLSATYHEALQGKDANFPKIQQEWLAQLEEFVADFPKADDAPEAMLQLALSQEFAGQDDAAKKWYNQIVVGFPEEPIAQKANGAIWRLNSVGQPLSLQGTTIGGAPFNLTTMKGKVVLVHYWATWCEPCKQDLTALKALAARFGDKGFALVGVNLDSEKPSAEKYLQGNRLAWPQLYAPGGLDSPLANQLGVLTLPQMLLVDQQGKVVNRNVQVGELEVELQKRLGK